MSTPAFCRVHGIRRVIKVYGPVDPAEQARREREWDRERMRVLATDRQADVFTTLMSLTRPIRKPHAGLKTSVKELWCSHPQTKNMDNPVIEYRMSRKP